LPVPKAFQALWEPGEARLKTLGFVPITLQGYQVILPPVCDIPAGPFLMGRAGDPEPVTLASSSEVLSDTPQFTIASPAYQMATYPLTVAEYACAVQAGVFRFYRSTNEWKTILERLDHPFDGLNWTLATVYAAWLSKLTGQDWQVPSEIEWEKAARSTDGRRYPWGNAWDPSRAHIGNRAFTGTAPIGSSPAGASPYGCQDMAGNVWEVTRSINASYPYDAQDGREDQLDDWLQARRERVIRGGSWEDVAESGQTTFRYLDDDAYYPCPVGVRLARRKQENG